MIVYQQNPSPPRIGVTDTEEHYGCNRNEKTNGIWGEPVDEWHELFWKKFYRLRCNNVTLKSIPGSLKENW